MNFSKRYSVAAALGLSLLFLSSCALQSSPSPGEIREVANLDFTPGNLTVTPEGRVFATVSPFRAGPARARLVEILTKESYRSYPNDTWNRPGQIADDRINSAFGLSVDRKKRLWIADHGNFISEVATPKILAFDLVSDALSFSYTLPNEAAPKGCFIQDLVVDDERDFIFLADAGGSSKPALIVVDARNQRSWRYDDLPQFQSEDFDLVVRGFRLTDPLQVGKQVPGRFALGILTLSPDGETVFFGATTGTSWYALPAALLRNHAPKREIAASIKRVGPKPAGPSAVTDSRGIHYFANSGSDAIDFLGADGVLRRLSEDDRLNWPDSLTVGPGGWLYIAATQQHRAAMFNGAVFNGGKEEGNAPYLILKVYSASPGIIGR
jgi:sugar lactone lactonase YvrE